MLTYADVCSHACVVWFVLHGLGLRIFAFLYLRVFELRSASRMRNALLFMLEASLYFCLSVFYVLIEIA